MALTFQKVKNNPFIREFIHRTEETMIQLGYNDHGFRHLELVARRAKQIAKTIGLSTREQELAQMAGYCHDLGNFLGRSRHHYWAALLFSQVFKEEIRPEELTLIMQAIVNHDKDTLKILNKISAVVILADKSDVHRSRVLTVSRKRIKKDIHDRVNYAVTDSKIDVDSRKKRIILKLKIDTKFVPLMDYFEIFTKRMSYCRKAARSLGYRFGLEMNNLRLL